ncbi:MAG: nicotinate-nucleotide--dimethylbenzimidazole phosphoribosyltransferase, partial [Planctomycetes bacterium]|nr:nicotinate-nucleotide--dimethylbenzimidazole phosphoribosyltransferase [Planctomycetota bacterium]
MKLLKHTLRHIEEVVLDAQGDIRNKFKAFAIPSGSLGRLEELAMIYASIKGDLNCKIKH